MVFWGVLAGSDPCVPDKLWAKPTLGQWSGGFKNHTTHNGTVFLALSMESWKDWKINAHVKRARR